MKLVPFIFAAALFLLPAAVHAEESIAADVRLDHSSWDKNIGNTFEEEDVTSEAGLERPSLMISDDADDGADSDHDDSGQ